jgi:hypothetical protein
MTTVTVLQTTLLMYTVAAGCFNWYITRKSCFGIFFTASTQRIFGVDFAVDLEEGELEAERLPVVYTTIEDGLGMIILFPADIHLLDAGQKLNDRYNFL